MLQPEQAKTTFRNILIWLGVAIFWPMLAIVIATVLGVADFNYMNLALIALGLIWVAINVWIIIYLWKLSPEVGITPWASLWYVTPWLGTFLVGMLYLEPLKYIGDNKPQDKRLPATWGLIKDSMVFSLKNFKKYSKTAVWYLYIALGTSLSAVLALFFSPYFFIHFLLMIGMVVFTAWVTIKLMLEIAALDSAREPQGDEGQTAKMSLVEYFALTLLIMVITAGPLIASVVVSLVLMAGAGLGMTLASGKSSAGLLQMMANSALPLIIVGILFAILFIASVVWAIYKSTQYAFALPALILEDRPQTGNPADRGAFKLASNALTKSTAWVTKRWWGTFWKNQMFGMTFGLGLVIVVQILSLAIIAITSLLFKNSALGSQASATLLSGALQGALQMVMMPVAFAFQIKMYKEFKRTAE